MTEADIFQGAIRQIEKGNMMEAARLLRKSSHPKSIENAENCERLHRAPNEFLKSMLLHLLRQYLEDTKTAPAAKRPAGTATGGARKPARRPAKHQPIPLTAGAWLCSFLFLVLLTVALGALTITLVLPFAQ